MKTNALKGMKDILPEEQKLRDYVQALFYDYNAFLLCVVNCISLDVDSTIYEEELRKAYIEFAEAKNCLNEVVLDKFPKAGSWNLNFEEGEIEVNGI